jgi:hypothetical protein
MALASQLAEIRKCAVVQLQIANMYQKLELCAVLVAQC